MTREEIVKAIKTCAKPTERLCAHCPLHEYDDCYNRVKSAAADLIERQSKQLAALVRIVNAKNAECDRIMRERYAAVKHLEYYNACRDCVGYRHNAPCEILEKAVYGKKCDNWQWRGLCAENGGDAEGETHEKV